MNIANLSPRQLRKAAAIKEKIQALQDELDTLLGAERKESEAAPKTTRRNKMSAAGRAKIRAAQKARWAKIKQDKAGK